MQPQVYNWTCSACALQWQLHASGLNTRITREETVYAIGYPEQINSSVGLTNINGPGQALINVLEQYGVVASQAWLNYSEVYKLVQNTSAIMSGSNWYHWVATRGINGQDLWIANSAPGYKGIWDILDEDDFYALGPFSVVFIER